MDHSGQFASRLGLKKGELAGIDAFVQMKIAGCRDLETSVRTVKCRHERGQMPRLTVGWYEQLTAQFREPALSDRIQLSVWDLDVVGIEGVLSLDARECVANTELSMRAAKHGMYSSPVWVPLYGPPAGTDTDNANVSIAWKCDS
jgi:hypothetical protein